MPNTIHHRLLLHTFESLFDFPRVVEVFLVHESMQLGAFVSMLHLTENQFDRLKIEAIGRVPNGIHVPLLHRCEHFISFVHRQVVKEDVDRLARSLFVQSLQEGDEGFGGDSSVEDHHSIDTAVVGDASHTSEVAMVEVLLVEHLVGSFRSILDTRNGTFGEDNFVHIHHALFQPPCLLQFVPTIFLPLQVLLDFLVLATFEAGNHFAFDLVLLVEANQPRH